MPVGARAVDRDRGPGPGLIVSSSEILTLEFARNAREFMTTNLADSIALVALAGSSHSSHSAGCEDKQIASIYTFQS